MVDPGNVEHNMGCLVGTEIELDTVGSPLQILPNNRMCLHAGGALVTLVPV